MVMSALDRKLLRDLWHMKGQVAAICAVMACGVATFVMSLTTLRSLIRNKDTYYASNRFADVFVQMKRAPNALAARLAQIEGVAQVETRVVRDVTLDLPQMPEPATGRLISMPEYGDPRLNLLYLRRGRWLEPGRGSETLVSEAFADAHALNPGDSVSAIINGRKQGLKIVGVVLSPEYIYQIRPGDILPDARRFGIFWMNYLDLAAAFDMQGAFNDASFVLMPGAIEKEVIQRIDRLSETYGSFGAYARADQVSHKFVTNEISELSRMALFAPSIFLSVTAFLLHVVLSRLIRTQREQIATLKAFGYAYWEIVWHYMKMVLVLVLIGCTVGMSAGAWMGSGLTQMYTKFFHFPTFGYWFDPAVAGMALLLCGGAAIFGAWFAVRSGTRLPPAEAMRPEPPAQFKPTILERLGLQRLFSASTRMILRQLERQPVKAAMSAFGIALAVSVLVLGSFMQDAVFYVMDTQFQLAQRQDVTLSFAEPTVQRALHDIEHLPGVRHCEPFRAVAATIRHGHLSRRIGVQGLEPGARLNLLMDMYRQVQDVPEDGLVLSRKLAELIQARVGDVVTLEVLEGERPVREAPVVRLIEDFSGTEAYMNRHALNRLLREGPVISGAHVAVDPGRIDDLYRTLKVTPRVAGVLVKDAALQSFRDTVAENMLRMRLFNVFFACIIAFGVVYNSVHIALAERSRELATLRVIGFTRQEVSRLLLGELAVLTLIAIPVGLLLGYGFAAMMVNAFDSELFRLPLIVERWTFGFAATVTLAAALVSGLIVRRKIDRLDLVGVLKTKE